MPKTLSIDIRERILKAYDQGNVTRQQVADRFDVWLKNLWQPSATLAAAVR
jgi:hypothetical protein